jgi:hypothetical protein
LTEPTLLDLTFPSHFAFLVDFGWRAKTVFSHPFLVKGSIGKGEQSREPTVLLLEGIDQDSAYFSLQFAGASLVKG